MPRCFLIALASLSASVAAAETIYNVSLSGPLSSGGEITVNGLIHVDATGDVTLDNITFWDLRFSSPGVNSRKIQIFNSEVVGFSDFGLKATPEELFVVIPPPSGPEEESGSGAFFGFRSTRSATIELSYQSTGFGGVPDAQLVMMHSLTGIPFNQSVQSLGGRGEFQLGVAQIPGDYNRDGTVDAADYTVWRDKVGDEPNRFTGADGDGDARVDGADYEVWKAHYGENNPAVAPAAVFTPEPSCALLVGVAVAIARVRRREGDQCESRRRRRIGQDSQGRCKRRVPARRPRSETQLALGYVQRD